MTDIQAKVIGHALNVASPHTGVVHSVFARAVNLDMREGMWTIVAEEGADLPFGVRLSSKDFNGLGLQPGDRVDVRAEFIGIETRRGVAVIDCRVAPRWALKRRAAPEGDLIGRLSVVEALARNRAWCSSADMADSIKAALNHPDAIGNVLAAVLGRGPGVTPAGDDVLVGIFAVLSSRSGPAAVTAADRLSRLIQPLLPTTTYISGHLLQQAINGLFARTVDELLWVLTADQPPDRLNAAIRRVVETGATSGADTCMGVIAFARTFLVPRHERTAAR
jgi:hypothetical protein